MTAPIAISVSLLDASQPVVISRGVAHEAVTSKNRTVHPTLIWLVLPTDQFVVTPWAELHKARGAKKGTPGEESPIKYPPHKRQTNGADDEDTS